MKVIFTQDVPSVASSGEIKDVANGYARNYLLPKGFAVVATRGEMERVEAQQRAKARQMEEETKEAQALAESLAGVSLVFPKKVRSNTDSIYGSVSGVAISQQLKRMGYNVDKNMVNLDEPIRKLGTEKVELQLAKDVTASISVTVEPEEEGAEKAAAGETEEE